ncbi:hypothetical protein [Halalkalibacterium ligniniphilum]|uniref:hypothetical protein n=1 Tax=Halalkalibacterium ligniniphilum TaxID=1134413 RepID=UPI00034A83A4|nr:hypothetical protein [Halalkalibacterium ligniniphilum]
MDVIIKRRRSVKEAGDLICTKKKKLYAIVVDEDERGFPYHLISLKNFTVIQSYDCLPTNKELEEDIGEKITGIYEHSDSQITLN